MLVHVTKLEPRGGHRLFLRFSDGTEGERDFAPLVAQEGEMLAPLRDPDYFARAFVELGAPSWPNGFDLDPQNLHDEMKRAGELQPAPSAAE